MPYGEMPEYKGKTPTKPADEYYTYTFAGWTPVISPVTGDAVYKAVYSKRPVQHSVDFDPNGGSPVPGQKINHGDKADKPVDPTKDGYDFGGWYSDKELTKPYDFNSPVKGDLKLYAKWIKKATPDGDKDSDSDDSDNGGKGSGSSPTGGHKSPKTGDENSMGLWIALLAAALLGTGGVFAVRRRMK